MIYGAWERKICPPSHGAFAEFGTLHRELATLIDGRTPNPTPVADWAPAVDIIEDDKAYVIKAELPAQHDQARTHLSALTSREKAIIRLIARGYANKEIAGLLEVSIKTVETHKVRAMEKLGLRNRVELVRHGAERGWLSDSPG